MYFKDLFKLSLIVSVMLIQQGCSSDDDSRTSRVVLGISDKISSFSDQQYQYAVVVQVAEFDGAPIPNATVSLKLKATGYYKGQYFVYDDPAFPPPARCTATEWCWEPTVTCVAEDTNNNGVLEAVEDTNGNGSNDPNIPSITPDLSNEPTLDPGTQRLSTDDSGFGYFTITYPKAEGTWVDIEISASISGGLPENQDRQAFTLNVLQSEIEEVDVFHAFVTSPYGTAGACNDPT
jgi:hypothetical protein